MKVNIVVRGVPAASKRQIQDACRGIKDLDLNALTVSAQDRKWIRMSGNLSPFGQSPMPGSAGTRRRSSMRCEHKLKKGDNKGEQCALSAGHKSGHLSEVAVKNHTRAKRRWDRRQSTINVCIDCGDMCHAKSIRCIHCWGKLAAKNARKYINYA